MEFSLLLCVYEEDVAQIFLSKNKIFPSQISQLERKNLILPRDANNFYDYFTTKVF